MKFADAVLLFALIAGSFAAPTRIMDQSIQYSETKYADQYIGKETGFVPPPPVVDVPVGKVIPTPLPVPPPYIQEQTVVQNIVPIVGQGVVKGDQQFDQSDQFMTGIQSDTIASYDDGKAVETPTPEPVPEPDAYTDDSHNADGLVIESEYPTPNGNLDQTPTPPKVNMFMASGADSLMYPLSLLFTAACMSLF